MEGVKKIAFILFMIYPIFSIGQDKRADKLFAEEDYKSALNSYLKSFEKEPYNANLAEKIALCYSELQDFLIASEYFKEAARLDPADQKYQMEYAQNLI